MQFGAETRQIAVSKIIDKHQNDIRRRLGAGCRGKRKEKRNKAAGQHSF
jgi:hypothetical protein